MWNLNLSIIDKVGSLTSTNKWPKNHPTPNIFIYSIPNTKYLDVRGKASG